MAKLITRRKKERGFRVLAVYAPHGMFGLFRWCLKCRGYAPANGLFYGYDWMYKDVVKIKSKGEFVIKEAEEIEELNEMSELAFLELCEVPEGMVAVPRYDLEYALSLLKSNKSQEIESLVECLKGDL